MIKLLVMKAKVIGTREVVNVTPYPTYYQEVGQGPDRREWSEDELEFEQVEYIRKDAFIEKACDWLKSNITNNPNANSVLVRNGCVTLGMLVEDFKKYMQGK